MTLRRLPEPRQRPWITVADLAAITGEGEKAIRAAIAAGTLPSIQVGRYVRIPTAALLVVLGISEGDGAAGGQAEIAVDARSEDKPLAAVVPLDAHAITRRGPPGPAAV